MLTISLEVHPSSVRIRLATLASLRCTMPKLTEQGAQTVTISLSPLGPRPTLTLTLTHRGGASFSALPRLDPRGRVL